MGEGGSTSANHHYSHIPAFINQAASRTSKNFGNHCPQPKARAKVLDSTLEKGAQLFPKTYAAHRCGKHRNNHLDYMGTTPLRMNKELCHMVDVNKD